METSGFQKQTNPKQKRNKKKKQVFNGDIVYIKQGAVQTVPSLSKQLKTVKEPVVGLQYVREYRSPSRTVPPHYHCRLCNVPLLMSEMVSHLIGWKHCLKYIKQDHPEIFSNQQDDRRKDKKALKEIALEVEKAEGRGQIKVQFMEPCDIPVFENMKSAFPTAKGSGAPGGPFGPVPRNFHSGGGRLPTAYVGDVPPLTELSFSRQHEIMGDRISDRMIERSMPVSSDGFGMGPRREDLGRKYPDDLFRNGSDRMMSTNCQESRNTLGTLLRCLDIFRIECEEDAQVVLKITQKLTDVLMDYRLRNVASGSRLNSLLSSDRFPANMSGPSRFYN